MYWKIDFWKKLGKRRNKDIEERSTLEDFLRIFNIKQNESYKFKKKGERPDFLCENDKGELIAVELKELADEGELRKKNLRIISRFQDLWEALRFVKRRVYFRDDIERLLARVNDKSFELLHDNVKFKFAVIDINDSICPEETLEDLKHNHLDLSKFDKIDAAFVLFYMPGASGSSGDWDYMEFWK